MFSFVLKGSLDLIRTKIVNQLFGFKRMILIFCLILTPHLSLKAEVNIMAPLLLNTESEWQSFADRLQILKASGVTAITTDIWWGMIEPARPGEYNWDYYERLAELIENSGLKWVPILSFHKLGGNIGDAGTVDIPKWVWSRFQNAHNLNIQSEEDMKFKSELGHTSTESVSVWATELILSDIERTTTAFTQKFSKYAKLVTEVNISLGPAGELRFPSYNQHDLIYDQSNAYPKRGYLQAYSRPAIESFREFVINKYGSIQQINLNWGFNLQTFKEIHPPGSSFWENLEIESAYGKDFFDWYNQSLVLHGHKILDVAGRVLSRSAFKNAAIGAKIPGIHWRVGSDRAAELCAGLVRSSNQSLHTAESNFGYENLIRNFKSKINGLQFNLHFTALEMTNGRDGYPENQPETLVKWIAQAAHQYGLNLKGENAIGSELYNQSAWEKMKLAVNKFFFAGITLLRMENFFNGTSSQGSNVLDKLKTFQNETRFVKSCKQLF